jgi:hypothetical protein
MKNLKIIALFIIVILLSSSATIQVMRVVPEKPKEIEVKVFYGPYGSQENRLNKFIMEYSKKGYIVKQISVSGDGVHGVIIVLMERY